MAYTSSSPAPGLLHLVTCSPTLSAFEFIPSSSSLCEPSTNILLWIGGLGDVLGTVSYIPLLAEELATEGWSVAQVLLSSCGVGWGTGSVGEDAKEIGEFVKYFAGRGMRQVVLMGHSTGAFWFPPRQVENRLILGLFSPRIGCQDIIAYFHTSSIPPIAGAILQAPVSDREYLSLAIPNLEATLDPSQPSNATIPPSLSDSPRVTYKRWRSLAAVPVSDEVDIDASEDFFSSDLTTTRLENVFAPVNAKLLILLSEEDESYPNFVKNKLLEVFEQFQSSLEAKWKSEESGILKGAGHAVHEEDGRREMFEKVKNFLNAL